MLLGVSYWDVSWQSDLEADRQISQVIYHTRGVKMWHLRTMKSMIIRHLGIVAMYYLCTATACQRPNCTLFLCEVLWVVNCVVLEHDAECRF